MGRLIRKKYRIEEKGAKDMSKNNMEQMKKLIEEKKKKSAQPGVGTGKQENKSLRNKNAFKTIKRGGALNK